MVQPAYNREIFPFSGVLEDLTETVIEQELSAYSAYIAYHQHCRQLGLYYAPDYAQTAITSGGHAHRPDVESRAVIEKNTENARQLMGELAVKRVITPERIVLPVDFGYIPHWQQSDYLTLWPLVIAGVNFGKAQPSHEAGFFKMRLQDSIKRLEVDLDLLNSKEPAEERAPEYFKFAQAFAETVPSVRAGRSWPVNRIIKVIDADQSLGCNFEQVFGRLIGTPVFEVGVAGPQNDSLAAVGDKYLREDLATIIKYGAAVMEMLPENQFLLRQVEAPELTSANA